MGYPLREMGILDTTKEAIIDPKIITSLVILFVLAIILFFYVGKKNGFITFLNALFFSLTLMVVLRSVGMTYVGLGNLSAFFISFTIMAIIGVFAGFMIRVLKGSASVVVSLLVSMYIPDTVIMLTVFGVSALILVVLAVKLGEQATDIILFMAITVSTSWMLVYCVDFFITVDQETFVGMIDDMRSGPECLLDEYCMVRIISVAILIFFRLLWYYGWSQHQKKEREKKERDKIVEVIKDVKEKEDKKKNKKRIREALKISTASDLEEEEQANEERKRTPTPESPVSPMMTDVKYRRVKTNNYLTRSNII